MKYIFTVLMLSIVLASCKKADAPTQKEASIQIKDTSKTEFNRYPALNIETLNKLSSTHVKDNKINGKKAEILLARNDKYFSKDSALYQELVLRPLMLFYVFHDLESYKVILPFKGKKKYMAVNRKQAEDFYGINFMEIFPEFDMRRVGWHDHWENKFLKIYNKPEKNKQFLDKFLLSD